MPPKKSPATSGTKAKTTTSTKPAAKAPTKSTTAGKSTTSIPSTTRKSSTTKTLTTAKTSTGKTATGKTAPKSPVKKSPTSEDKMEDAAAAKPAAAPVEPQTIGATIGLKAFAKYVIDDTDNDLRKSGRWPLISDEAERATTFLRYRNTNVLNVMNQNDMEANRIRLAIIGGLRYGKPVVFDMMTTNMAVLYPRLVEYVDAVKPGLMDAIISKEVLKEDYYMQLVNDDDSDYKIQNFNDTFKDNFQVIIATGLTDFPPEVNNSFFIVTVE